MPPTRRVVAIQKGQPIFRFRANGQLPEDPQVHKYLLAYASDFNLITTSLQPHGASFMQRAMHMASLDHVREDAR